MSNKNNNIIEKFRIALASTSRVISDDFEFDKSSEKKKSKELNNFEIDNLRNKYSEENDEEKLKFLDQLNDFVMLIQKKYENS